MPPTGASSPQATRRPFPVVSSLLLGAAVLLFALPGVSGALAFDRMAVNAGQLWRLATAHLTHWTLDQLFWDGAVFLALGAICERRSRARTFACMATSAIAITGALWLLAPGLATYRGLSGIDSALFAMLAVWLGADARRDRDVRRLAIVLAATLAFSAKVTFECLTGTTLFVTSSGAMQPIPLAHVIGAAVGLILGCRSAPFPKLLGALANPRGPAPRAPHAATLTPAPSPAAAPAWRTARRSTSSTSSPRRSTPR